VAGFDIGKVPAIQTIGIIGVMTGIGVGCFGYLLLDIVKSIMGVF
jgi:hypothetical protein